MKLLLIEDNLNIANDLVQFLTENSFIVEHVSSVAGSSEKIHEYDWWTVNQWISTSMKFYFLVFKNRIY